jgi:uncharacterized protein (TIGR02268 family)
MGERGVVAQVLKKVTLRSGDPFAARNVISYRAVGPRGQGGVAVEVELFNRGPRPWTPTGAALMGAHGAVLAEPKVWPLEPIPPRERRRVVVEVVATESEARGTFTLKLWEGQDGAGGVSLGGVTFP